MQQVQTNPFERMRRSFPCRRTSSQGFMCNQGAAWGRLGPPLAGRAAMGGTFTRDYYCPHRPRDGATDPVCCRCGEWKNIEGRKSQAGSAWRADWHVANGRTPDTTSAHSTSTIRLNDGCRPTSPAETHLPSPYGSPSTLLAQTCYRPAPVHLRCQEMTSPSQHPSPAIVYGTACIGRQEEIVQNVKNCAQASVPPLQTPRSLPPRNRKPGVDLRYTPGQCT